MQLCDDLAALRLVAAVVQRARYDSNPTRTKGPLSKARRRQQQQAAAWLDEFLNDTDGTPDLWPTENPSYRNNPGVKLA